MMPHIGNMSDGHAGLRQHANVDGFKNVLYDSGYMAIMGSGVVMPIRNTTWLLFEKW